MRERLVQTKVLHAILSADFPSFDLKGSQVLGDECVSPKWYRALLLEVLLDAAHCLDLLSCE